MYNPNASSGGRGCRRLGLRLGALLLAGASWVFVAQKTLPSFAGEPATLQPRLVLKVPSHPSPRLGSGTPERLLGLDFAPDAQTLATVHEDGSIQLWDAATGAEVTTRPTDPDLLWPLSGGGFLPGMGRFSVGDGPGGSWRNYLVSADGKWHCRWGGARLAVWDAATGQRCFVIPFSGSEVYVTFSPDSSLLAAKDIPSGAVHVWQVPSGQPCLVAQGSEGYATGGNLAFCPRGNFLAVEGAVKESIELLDPRTGQRCASLGGQYATLRFSADGRWLALASGEDVNLYDLSKGAAVTILKGEGRAVRGLAFAPDSAALASFATAQLWPGDAPGEIKVWDLAHGSERAATTVSDLVWGSLVFSPGGQLLGIEAPLTTQDSALVALQGGQLQLLCWGGGDAGSSFNIDRHQHRFAFTPDGRTALVRRMGFVKQSQAAVRWSEFTRLFRKTLREPLCLINADSGKTYAYVEGAQHWLLSPDGKTVATQVWSGDVPVKEVLLWDVPPPPQPSLRAPALLMGATLFLLAFLWYVFRRTRQPTDRWRHFTGTPGNTLPENPGGEQPGSGAFFARKPW